MRLMPVEPVMVEKWLTYQTHLRGFESERPEPSFLQGSTLGSDPVQHQDCDWVQSE